ncbi:P-type DNA transfer protein VirB5 [Paraburkholderia ultramafica]|nr:P-type DNA transfer protein VirB5 [Paraburkholderia ultramafica]
MALSPAAYAQVPVTVTSDIPGAVFHAEDIAKYTAQLEQLKMQVQQLQMTYNSLNGSTGIANLFRSSGLASALPPSWQGIYATATSGGYSGISGSVSALTAAERVVGSVSSAQAAIVARQNRKAITDQAIGQAGYAAATQRLNDIEAMTQQINASTSPKQIMDLQARIASEQSAIQNEQTKLQLATMLQRNEDALIERQKDQVNATVFSPNNTAVPGLGD